VKNPKTKTYKAVKSIKADRKLALSGTPIENNLTELWALFNLLMPGFLGTEREFNENFKNPIEKKNDKQAKKLLAKKIKPFILRRTKESVLKELPPKIEILKYTKFKEKQAKLYETVRVSLNKKIRDLLKKQKLEKSYIHILDALLKLRQIACDPRLLNENKDIKESAKLELLEDLLEELTKENRKILIFSQFVKMLNIIEKDILLKKDYKYLKLTGQTRKREEIIRKFKEDENINIFLISLKAGGLGLNLTEADTVIIYDPWWNPFTEQQAIDRAYRIGQENKVFVYKLIVENSIEEKILKLQEAKKALQTIYEKDISVFKLSKEDIESLF
ncbi:MAG: helicase SNF2, partial [Persephonella sp.]